ncbi:DUF2207 domain-containing protein [Capilliphycus salinus ALCB114379]|uniref:DUF2207 domain-containing protein n=1 Tax=Capilliphycus salinus TaxID=2768948 RepID=UPI0039A579AF
MLMAVGQENYPFYWEFLNVNIDVQENGDMLVSETHKYVFTQPHTQERSRYIPLDKVDNIKDVAVFENNQKIPAKIEVENHQLWIKWQHQLNPPEAHTFVLKYRVIGGLQVSEDEARVYWKAIFSGRNAPIQNAKVVVRFPEVLSGKITEYTSYGILTQIRQINPYTFQFIGQKPVLPGQEIEVFVAFPRNLLNVSTPNFQPVSFLNSPKTDSFSDVFEDIKVVIFIIFGFIFSLLVLIMFIKWCKQVSRRPNRSRSTKSTPNRSRNTGGYSGGSQSTSSTVDSSSSANYNSSANSSSSANYNSSSSDCSSSSGYSSGGDCGGSISNVGDCGGGGGGAY